MATHTFFVMVKPDGVARGLVGEIISRFERRGFTMNALRLLYPNQVARVIREHYEVHRTHSYYETLIEFSLSGPVIAMIWEGDVKVARQMIGATLPWEAVPGTIRGDLACRVPQNLVHCSDGIESAGREVELWKGLLDSL